MIDKDEFTNWLDHPITRDYFARIEAEVSRTKAHWDVTAWSNGDLTERNYAAHKERVETLEFMRNLAFEDLYPKEEE